MISTDYDTQAAAFRAQLLAGAIPDDPAAWLHAPAELTCQTADCQAQGVTVAWSLAENADGLYRALCGWCQRPTAVVLVFTDGRRPVTNSQPAGS